MGKTACIPRTPLFMELPNIGLLARRIRLIWKPAMATPRPRVGQPAWVSTPALADGAVYALGQVTGQTGDACEVRLAGAAEPVQVPAASCWPVNEPGSHVLHDLTELHFAHEAALLAHVRERYSGGSIYTYVGQTLVSLNPFRELPGVYGKEAC